MSGPVLDSLPFTARWLLAPMEGITDPTFRSMLLGLHQPEHLGGAFTEFVRVVERPKLVRELARHIGTRQFAMPVGVQLMGSHLEALAGSAANAVEAGAPLLDLNFGCPAKGALRGHAGSALLRDPPALEAVVSACVRAVQGAVPVTAKIRAGYDHARDVEPLARAAEAGGAALLTIHCRTRQESYQPQVDWTRIARAVAAVSIPVCGNGGVVCHADLARMRAETGCAFVMVGRGALADPWIFSGHQASPAQAVRFLERFVAAMSNTRRRGAVGAVARVKQLIRRWQAGGLLSDEAERKRWLRECDPTAFLALLADARTAATVV